MASLYFTSRVRSRTRPWSPARSASRSASADPRAPRRAPGRRAGSPRGDSRHRPPRSAAPPATPHPRLGDTGRRRHCGFAAYSRPMPTIARASSSSRSPRSRGLERLVRERQHGIDVLSLDGRLPCRDQGIDLGGSHGRRTACASDRHRRRPRSTPAWPSPPFGGPTLEPQEDPRLERIGGDLQVRRRDAAAFGSVEPTTRVVSPPEVVGGERGAEICPSRQPRVSRGPPRGDQRSRASAWSPSSAARRGRGPVDAAGAPASSTSRADPAIRRTPSDPISRRCGDPRMRSARSASNDRRGHAMLEHRQHDRRRRPRPPSSDVAMWPCEPAPRRLRDAAHDDVADQVVGEPR